MKTVGIIAEYNPFHNGHAYHIARAKELTGADHCIVVMSGDFVQRGAPALMDKYTRAEAALYSGADLVLELPVYYSLGSAEHFASGAIALLDRLGVVDSICFGSECGDIQLLMQFAHSLLEESPVFRQTLRQRMKDGTSYPIARSAALIADNPALSAHIKTLKTPNNILGIEYCKALLRRNSAITPYTLSRNGASYHDASISTSFCSALAIREALAASASLESIKGQLPPESYRLMEQNIGVSLPVFADDFSLLLHYQLLSEQESGFETHPDIDEALSDRIVRLLPDYRSFSGFCELLKTKDRTYTRIARSMMHILLRMDNASLMQFRSEDYVAYARMLGFCKEASALFSAIKEKSSIPLLSKLADAPALLSDTGKKMLEKDIYASHIYESVVQNKFTTDRTGCPANEYKRKMLRV